MGIVSRWDSQKDIGNLISAFSMLQGLSALIKFVIVGKGLTKENSDFLDLLTSFRIDMNNLILEGPINDVQGVLCGIDLKVLSSRGEAFPNVLVEAMLCERNCLSTNVGDVSDILCDNNWIVDKEDSRQLFLAMQSAFEKWNNERDSYVENGRLNRKHIINNFSVSRMYENYMSFWNS